MKIRQRQHRGFTIVEIVVVVGIIAVLAGILLTSLASATRTGAMAETMSNMRQIGQWIDAYAQDNRDQVLPSQFDYAGSTKTKVRRPSPPGSTLPMTSASIDENQGTWTDILWTIHELGNFPDSTDATVPTYRFDSPDMFLYDRLSDVPDNPFRSVTNNSRNLNDSVVTGDLPTPFGNGPDGIGRAGYLAANNFFNTSSGWYSMGQIVAPSRSMYLVDSVAGETIEPIPAPFDDSPGSETLEVDFRYNGTCLMLFLDGHVDPQAAWESLDDLQRSDGSATSRNIRVQNLTTR